VYGVSYVAQADIFYQLRINIHLPEDLLEELENEAIERSVFETTFLALGKRCPDSERDDHIVGVLRGAVQRPIISNLIMNGIRWPAGELWGRA
jgi:hypothetical protein